MNLLLKKLLPRFVQRIKFFENCFIPRDTIFTRFLSVTILILLVSFQIISAQDCAQIMSQSDNASVCAGSAAAFSVKASGTGLTYQWQVSADGGNTFQPVASVNSNQQYNGWSTSDLSLTSANASLNGYRYRCVINSPAGARFHNAFQ